MRRFLVSAILVCGAALSGCSFEHAVAVEFDHMVSDHKAGSGRPYQIQGFVHAEAWTPAFLYVFPLLPSQSSERAKELAISTAQSMGADAVTDVRLHVETHMPFLWLAGWKECHVSATAISYK